MTKEVRIRKKGSTWENGKMISEDLVRIILMAEAGGYVMVRKPRTSPFVMPAKEFRKLPLAAKRSKP